MFGIIIDDGPKLYWALSTPLLVTYLFVLRFYGPVNPMGSCRARSVFANLRTHQYWYHIDGSEPIHTFTGQAYSSKRLTSIVHILSPENDNCPSFMINLHERILPTSAEIEPATSWSPVGRASNWATETGCSWPIGQGHGLSIFTLKFCVKYFKIP